jgi:hypothetical protein
MKEMHLSDWVTSGIFALAVGQHVNENIGLLFWERARFFC